MLLRPLEELDVHSSVEHEQELHDLFDDELDIDELDMDIDYNDD